MLNSRQAAAVGSNVGTQLRYHAEPIPHSYTLDDLALRDSEVVREEHVQGVAGRGYDPEWCRAIVLVGPLEPPCECISRHPTQGHESTPCGRPEWRFQCASCGLVVLVVQRPGRSQSSAVRGKALKRSSHVARPESLVKPHRQFSCLAHASTPWSYDNPNAKVVGTGVFIVIDQINLGAIDSARSRSCLQRTPALRRPARHFQMILACGGWPGVVATRGPCHGPLARTASGTSGLGCMTGAASDGSGSLSASFGWTITRAGAAPRTLINKKVRRLTGLFDLGRLVAHRRASRNAVAAASSTSAIRC
jgi:hypothetical protein